jgi:hypothetical protein
MAAQLHLELPARDLSRLGAAVTSGAVLEACDGLGLEPVELAAAFALLGERHDGYAGIVAAALIADAERCKAAE